MSERTKIREMKRQAIQIVAQLPDDLDEAYSILEFAKELLSGYLADAKRPAVVLTLVRD